LQILSQAMSLFLETKEQHHSKYSPMMGRASGSARSACQKSTLARMIRQCAASFFRNKFTAIP